MIGTRTRGTWSPSRLFNPPSHYIFNHLAGGGGDGGGGDGGGEDGGSQAIFFYRHVCGDA